MAVFRINQIESTGRNLHETALSLPELDVFFCIVGNGFRKVVNVGILHHLLAFQNPLKVKKIFMRFKFCAFQRSRLPLLNHNPAAGIRIGSHRLFCSRPGKSTDPIQMWDQGFVKFLVRCLLNDHICILECIIWFSILCINHFLFYQTSWL